MQDHPVQHILLCHSELINSLPENYDFWTLLVLVINPLIL